MPTRSCSAFSSILSERRSFASSAPSGSSSSSTAGLSTSARASAIRCCCPPDSWPGRRLANAVILTSCRASFTRRLSSVLLTPWCRSPKATLSKTDRNGNSAELWNTVLTLRRCGGTWDTSTPSSRIRPEVGCSKPAISRRVVVLPQPDGPSREKNSPLATVRSMLSTAISLNLLVSPDSSMLPPATASPLQLRSAFARPPARGRGRGRPVEPKLPGREPHRKIVRALRRHHRVLERDLHREPVQQGGQHDREIVRLLAGQHDGADGLPPPLVGLLPHRAHPGVPRGQRPKVQPEQPVAVRLGVGAGQAVHADQLGHPPRRGRDLLHPPQV